MNRILSSSLALAFLCLSICSHAQDLAPVKKPDLNRPLLFAHLPATIPVTIADLEGLLNPAAAKDATINLRSSDRTLSAFRGNIIANVTRHENKVKSVLIRSVEFSDATFSLSSSTNPDGTVSYRGRIVSFKHGDAYELQQRGDGYVLQKKNFYEIVSE